MTRGRIKMMGLARTSIMVAFWTASANLRLIDAFERGEERANDPDYEFIPRQPRKQRAVPYADPDGNDPPANRGPTPNSDSKAS